MKHICLKGGRNRVSEALDLLEKVPAPFFRGRGGATLLIVTSLLGYGDLVRSRSRDYFAETLQYVDRDEEINIPPSFPQAMSPAFSRIYPRLTMLNAIAAFGEEKYLCEGRERLKDISALWHGLQPVEKTHMGLYYILSLSNLGAMNSEISDLDSFLEEIVNMWRFISPGSDYFLNEISYPYIIQTAAILGRLDLIDDETFSRLANAFIDLDRSDEERVNRPYPFSYALNILAENCEDYRLFEPTEIYRGKSAIEWLVDNLFAHNGASSKLYMLNNALIGYALRQRDSVNADTSLFRSFRFSFACPSS